MSKELEQADELRKEGLLSPNELAFLEMAHNPLSRSNLLARLEKLGLLSAFLEAESGTTG